MMLAAVCKVLAVVFLTDGDIKNITAKMIIKVFIFAHREQLQFQHKIHRNGRTLPCDPLLQTW